jgi:hypothetical protein
MRFKRIAQNVILVVLAIGVAAVLGEIALRVITGDKFGKRPGFYVADELIGWKPASNLDHSFYGADFKINIETDADGHRLGALGPVDTGKELILICGDSNVFGWGVSTGETCPSYLDEMVYEASGSTQRVVNLGVAGYGTMQSFITMEEYIAFHNNTRFPAVIFVHSTNDPVDNMQSIGYHIRAWEVFNKEPKERSSLHVANFFGYAAQVLRGKIGDPPQLEEAAQDGLNPYLRDVLHAYAYKLPRKLPSTVVFKNDTLNFSRISEEDYSIDRLMERRSSTNLQKDLISAAINSLHRFLENRDTIIFHLIIPNAPDWFVSEMQELIETSSYHGKDEVIVLGRFPAATDDFEGEMINTHSGKHYTPEFNRYWAGKIMEELRRHHVVRR